VTDTPFGVLLTVAYDGTDFAGWQRQPEQRTVQGVLHAAVSTMAGQCSNMRGCSRTDSGVHALGQEVSFAAGREIPPDGWLQGLNRALPDDVAVQRAEACGPDYDPRRDVISKLYRYTFRTGRARNPLTRHRAWHIGPPLALPHPRGERDAHIGKWLDLEAMQSAADLWVGEHDFHAMRAASDDREQTIRRMDSLRVTSDLEGDPTTVSVEVRGNAFMKNMVRIMAGTLLDIGRHHLPVERAAELVLPSAVRRAGGPTAPAHGLTLVEIHLGRRD